MTHMKNHGTMKLGLALITFVVMGATAGLTGCGGGSDGDQENANEGVSGSWAMTLVWNGSPGIKTGTLHLQQTGNTISGNVSLSLGTAGDVSGTISGTAITFSGTGGFTGYNQFSGTINGDTMSGVASSTILNITDGSWSAYRD